MIGQAASLGRSLSVDDCQTTFHKEGQALLTVHKWQGRVFKNAKKGVQGVVALVGQLKYSKRR